jgi:hypothetical protein
VLGLRGAESDSPAGDFLVRQRCARAEQAIRLEPKQMTSPAFVAHLPQENELSAGFSNNVGNDTNQTKGVSPQVGPTTQQS